MNKLPEGLGFLLADVARLMRRDFAKRLEGSSINFAQARVLLALARQQGINQVELAQVLELRPLALSRLVDQLASRRLIERRPDPHDGRAHQLYLRPSAAAPLAAIAQVVEAIRVDAVRDIDETQIATMTAGLERIKANVRLCADDDLAGC